MDLSDRGERSPPERATGVDFELLPSIHLDILPDLAVGHLETTPYTRKESGPLVTAASDTRVLVTGQ